MCLGDGVGELHHHFDFGFKASLSEPHPKLGRRKKIDDTIPHELSYENKVEHFETNPAI